MLPASTGDIAPMISVIICSIDDQKFAHVTDSFAQAFTPIRFT